MRPEIARQKFWARVDRQPDGCWRWLGAKVKSEGLLTWEGLRQYAPRVAWKLIHGRLASYLELVRTCGTADCVRPSHHYARCRAHRVVDCPQCGGEHRARLLLQLIGGKDGHQREHDQHAA